MIPGDEKEGTGCFRWRARLVWEGILRGLKREEKKE